MRSWGFLFALSLSLLLVASSCALRVHSIGAHSPLHPDPLDREAGLCVVKSPEAEGEAWDDELMRNIEFLLTRKGYRIASSSDARYYLFFDYRVRGLMARMRLDFISGSQTGMETGRREGPFVHTVALRVVDADAFRDREEEEVIWSGGAVMSDVPTEGKRFRDMVLVAAVEQFDRMTDETTTQKMRRNDPRVRRLPY